MNNLHKSRLKLIVFVIKVVNFQKTVKVVLILVLCKINLSTGEVFCGESSYRKILTGSSMGVGRRENDICAGRLLPNIMVLMINSDEPNTRC